MASPAAVMSSFDVGVLARASSEVLGFASMDLILGHRRYDVTHRPLVMGILNRTRDSFFDGGRYLRLDALLRRAEQLVDTGADILEIGARPGGVGVADVNEPTETDLVCESIAALGSRFDVPLAVDTWRASVARAAFCAGAVLGNDMSGFSDEGYLAAAVQAGASVVATHIRLAPQMPDPEPRYGNLVAEVACKLSTMADGALAAGLQRGQVILDPGLDLGKTWMQSVQLLAAFDRFAGLGHPVLLAASNKVFLGRLLDLEKHQRGHATVAACAIGTLRGARLLRVHDAIGVRHAADLSAAVLSC